MNILVTGASGFIGRRLSARLMAQGHHVYGLSVHKSPQIPVGFKYYYEQDMTRPFCLNEDFDIAIHLAAYNITNVGLKDTGLYNTINVEGTRHLLEAVKVKRFIYLSTTKVYKNEGSPITEISVTEPQGAYEQSKLKAEELCSGYFEKQSLVILRSVNVIGWGQAPKAVVPVFFQKAYAHQPLDIINGMTLMQFVYVEDLIDAILQVVVRQDARGIFNIANGEMVSLGALARMIIKESHSSSILNISKSDQVPPYSRIVCDKALDQLGWRPKITLARV